MSRFLEGLKTLEEHAERSRTIRLRDDEVPDTVLWSTNPSIEAHEVS
ncbi:hypothetical protein [Persicimonas caeni]|nr:hypothetical protein [Persicimonas caeni]